MGEVACLEFVVTVKVRDEDDRRRPASSAHPIGGGYAARNPAPTNAGDPVIVHVTFTAQGDLDDFDARMHGFAAFLSCTPGLTLKVRALDRDTRAGSGTYLSGTRRHANQHLGDIHPNGIGNVPYVLGIETAVPGVMVGPSSMTRIATAADAIAGLEGRARHGRASSFAGRISPRASGSPCSPCRPCASTRWRLSARRSPSSG